MERICFAKHRRIHFCHFVKLWLRGRDDALGKPMREVTFARTGKDLVLPRAGLGAPEPDLYPGAANGQPVALRPTRQLGPTVNVDPDHGKAGLVTPIRWNPLEGSSNGPVQVSLRGNADYQNMLQTLQDGFNPSVPDTLRGVHYAAGAAVADAQHADSAFEKQLPRNIKAALTARAKKGLEEKSAADIEEELRAARERRRAKESTGGPGVRFRRWVRALVVGSMKNSMQAMFYARDYSTKPNMTCAPLLVAIRDGVRRLEERLREEEEAARSAEPAQASAAGFGGCAGRPSGGHGQEGAPSDETRRRGATPTNSSGRRCQPGHCQGKLLDGHADAHRPRGLALPLPVAGHDEACHVDGLPTKAGGPGFRRA